ncbi:MAG: hypothetical protein LKK13_00975 [Bacilli bacterium]|jgi:serine protease inhibitor|nr:hypothetical protein [Bacilli bacterium]
MKKTDLRKAFQADFRAVSPVPERFPVETLPSNEKRYVNLRGILGWTAGGIAIAFGLVVVIAISSVLAMGFRTEESLHREKRVYAQNVGSALKEDYFKALNSVEYPSLSGGRNQIEAAFVDDAQKFTNSVYGALDIGGSNFAFAPLSLYGNLMMASSAYEGDQSGFDSLLGGEAASRASEFRKAYENDYFVDADGSLQMYNGAFLSSTYRPNRDYVNALSAMYAEAYGVDFTNEKAFAEISKWADERVDEDGFISPEEIECENPLLYLLSTFSFKGTWRNGYSTADTKEGLFVSASGESQKIDFMNHLYGGLVYEFGDYVAVDDQYNDDLDIVYLTPRSSGDDILALTSGKDIFALPEENLASTLYVDLTVPKFSLSSELRFGEALSSLGLGDLYDPSSSALAGAFADYPDGAPASLEETYQKNEISMDEDGTTAKSVTFSLGGGAAAPVEEDNTYVVDLDSPFLFYIKDASGIPLFMGYVAEV